MTAAHLAAAGSHDCLELFLQAGVPPDWEGLLVAAAQSGAVDCCALLLRAGAGADNAAIEAATSGRHWEAATILLLAHNSDAQRRLAQMHAQLSSGGEAETRNTDMQADEDEAIVAAVRRANKQALAEWMAEQKALPSAALQAAHGATAAARRGAAALQEQLQAERSTAAAALAAARAEAQAALAEVGAARAEAQAAARLLQAAQLEIVDLHAALDSRAGILTAEAPAPARPATQLLQLPAGSAAAGPAARGGSGRNTPLERAASPASDWALPPRLGSPQPIAQPGGRAAFDEALAMARRFTAECGAEGLHLSPQRSADSSPPRGVASPAGSASSSKGTGSSRGSTPRRRMPLQAGPTPTPTPMTSAVPLLALQRALPGGGAAAPPRSIFPGSPGRRLRNRQGL